MKMLLFAALLASLCGVSAQAREYQLPEANPAVSVTLPDSWKPTTTDTGAEATSPDGGAYISVDTATAKSMDGLIDDDIRYLTESGVTLDPATQTQGELQVAGRKAAVIRWHGKDKDGPTAVTLIIVGISDKVALIVTAWASPEAETKLGADMNAVLDSIHPI